MMEGNILGLFLEVTQKWPKTLVLTSSPKPLLHIQGNPFNKIYIHLAFVFSDLGGEMFTLARVGANKENFGFNWF